MKKLILLFIAVATTAMSANVFAQGTGLAPEVGSVHDYSVTFTSGNTYAWDITSDPAGANTVVGTVATATPNADGNLITVTWVNPDVANNKVYFVHVIETDASSCTNHKVLAVQPVNNFTLNIVNVDNTGANLSAADSLDNAVCAPDVAVTGWVGTDSTAYAVTSLNSTGFTYDYGTVVFYYKISASGINVETTSWTPEFTIEQVAGTNATITIDSIVGGATPSGTWATTSWPTDGSTTISPTIPEGTGNDVLWVRVTVVNGDGVPSAVNENLTDNDFTFTLTGGSDENNNPQNSLGNTETIQTQSARPSTTDIQTDN